MSQAQSQSAKAAANMDRGEKERKVNELVKFLLVMDQKKLPIKKQDINKHVLKEHSKAFLDIKNAAAARLEKVFGIELVEMEDKFKGSFILVNKIETDTEQSHLEWGEDDDSKMGLIMVVLSLIFMSGNVLQDSQLYNSLKKLGINPDITHEVFGDIKKLLTQEFVRQGYLEMTRQPNMDPPVTEFGWGQRAKLETSKRRVLEFVSKVYGIESQQWTTQWQDVQLSEADNPNTQQPSTSSQLPSSQVPPSQRRSGVAASQARSKQGSRR